MTSQGKEYGEALYELARDENLRETLMPQLNEIWRVMSEQPQFLQLLCSHAIERETRVKVVDDTFGNQAHPYLVSFMKLLVEKERFYAFGDCVKWFADRYNEDFRIVEASVTSAIPLSEERLEALKAKLKEISGRDVVVSLNVDPGVIGGIRVEMDGRRYDNTIQNRLDRLRRNLVNNL